MERADIYPMMNFGPPASANLEKKVGTEAAKLCKTVKDASLASWQDGMEADDPRLLAVEQALDACTAAPAQSRRHSVALLARFVFGTAGFSFGFAVTVAAGTR